MLRTERGVPRKHRMNHNNACVFSMALAMGNITICEENVEREREGEKERKREIEQRMDPM